MKGFIYVYRNDTVGSINRHCNGRIAAIGNPAERA